MARKKVVKQEATITTATELNESVLTDLTSAIEDMFHTDFGDINPPDPYMTPTGIRHLDAILGGGFTSSAPICLTSTPETGKSTIAFQFSKIFLNFYKNAMVVYLDVEGAGGIAKKNETEKEEAETEFKQTRAEIFGLDKNKNFMHRRVLLTTLKAEEVISSILAKKRKVEEATKGEIKVLIILDSLASLLPSRIQDATGPEQITGLKARELGFILDKLKVPMMFDKITFLTIDQVRSHIVIDRYKKEEKSVGIFNNIKAASGANVLQHSINQWLFFSKSTDITLADGFGVDGWYMNIFTEKNKCAPSKYEITCVFDKNIGIDKFNSEYEFLSDYTPTEKKLDKKSTTFKPFAPLFIELAAYNRLKITHPETKEILYESKGFRRSEAKKKYETEEEFRQWFDYAVDLAVEYRIKRGLMRLSNDVLDVISDEEIEPEITVDDLIDESIMADIIND